jgi:hypothetical protein
VDTAWCDSNGTKSLYTTEFAGTSSASAIIAGVALVVQGVAQAKLKRRFSAWQMRAILGDTTLGTPGALPPKAMVGDPGIGVMPDLKAVLSKALNVVPDVYLRDFVGDNGDPHAGAINASPDIILRTAKEADPKAAFGEGSATQNSNISSHKAKKNQDNYIYVRVRNRGGAAAKGVVATVYHSEVSSLVTPLLWSKAGSIKLPDVPAGDLLTVSDPPITWPAAQIPKPGHYCFVALIGNAEDPAPVPADFMNWKTFRRLIRENNNVTWRNFQVVGNTPKPPVPPMPETDYVELPFLAPGAPDKDRRMALSISAQLPEGADCRLEAPTYLADALGAFSPEVRVFPDRDVAWLPLNPHGHTLIGEALFGQGSVHELKVLVDIPERYRRHAYELYVSQLYEGEEVGRITWRLAPER